MAIFYISVLFKSGISLYNNTTKCNNFLRSNMGKKAAIQTDFVVDVFVEVEAQVDDDLSQDLVFKMVDKDEFCRMFRETYPAVVVTPEDIWHNLMGNHPLGTEEGQNKQVRYLTEDSCRKIIDHYQLFISGIDFNNLPSGFFLTKNPMAGGNRDVLHYSEFLANKLPTTNSLAVVLSPKKLLKFLGAHEFKGVQAKWYDFLRSKINKHDNSLTYCTEKELENAFITFSNTLKLLEIEFEEPDFTLLKNTDLNPIVLLGRWNAVLTQPNLKPEDTTRQFKALLKLELAAGYNALRAINDYEGTENPCGFIIPEMFSIRQFHDVSNVQKVKDISYKNSVLDFWRYIAYQPQRNSIDYYEKGLAKIKEMKINQDSKCEFSRMLAGSSTGGSHFSKTGVKEAEKEALELDYWSKFCDLIDNLATFSLNMRTYAAIYGEERLKGDFIYHIHRLEQYPNIPMFHSVAQCIQEHLSSINPLGSDPLRELRELSDKTDSLIRRWGSDFFKGARFYFVEGKWQQLDFQSYVALQNYFISTSGGYADLIAPYLSTFGILTQENIGAIQDIIESKPENKDLKYCLGLFEDVIKPCTLNDLLKIIAGIHNREDPFISLMSVLEYVEMNFSDKFPEHYFEKKKKELLDAEKGLNEEQILAVHQLKFSDEQTKLVLSIESGLVQNNFLTKTPELKRLNDSLATLNRVITGSDFTFLLERLESMRTLLPKDSAILVHLIMLLSKQRNISDFKQIYYRNQIEKCADDSFIPKLIVFIEQLKPKVKALGSISSFLVQELMASFVLNSTLSTAEEANFVVRVEAVLASVEQITGAHPHLQRHLFDALNNISGKQTELYFQNVEDCINCLARIAKLLPPGDDEEAQKNMLNIYSLLASFYKDPMELVTLWKTISTLGTEEQQKFVLVLVNKLIQNKQQVSNVKEFVDQLNTDSSHFDSLKNYCAEPPFPQIPVMTSWLRKGTIEAGYKKFNIQPYGPRRLDFAFDLKKFEVQKGLFKGVSEKLFTKEMEKQGESNRTLSAKELSEKLFTTELGLEMDKQLKSNRTLSVKELRAQFDALKTKAKAKELTSEEKLTLLCACVDMLARTSSQLDDSTPPKPISQEVNTTQMMALYAMITNPNSKLINEIETGEGKSRMTMILAACQVAQGKTVDFLTSDMQLAERDFLTYNNFFTSLGIRTSLISLSTPKQLYQKGGINFSDNAQLLLLRNRHDIRLERNAFLEEDPKKRCLIIDEEDKFIHDRAKDSFNFATSSKELRTFTWIYPLLVDFVEKTITSDVSKPFKADTLIEDFLNYVTIHDKDELHQSCVGSLGAHHKDQLITWFNSAYKALHMKEDEDYKVTEDKDDKLIRIRDAEGFTRYTRQVLVLDSGRPVEGATFSLGVHQCLCAIENKKAKKESFVILPENAVQRSLFPVSFMAQYEQGSIYGVSGTTRYEAPTGDKKGINYENYDYLVVPRHKPVRREEKNIWLAKDEQQQIEFLKRDLREKLNQKPPRPSLLICRNDEQSRLIYEALKSDVELMKLVKKCTCVDALTEKEKEVAAINEAGEPGMITISTVGMFGRGVDINAENLFVTALYVPTIEDEKQIKGRTARAGKEGEYRMILNRTDPYCPIKKRAHNVIQQVDKIQKKMAVQAVNQEEIAKLYAGFLENIHEIFLQNYATTPNTYQFDLLKTWQNYLNEIQKAWDSKKEELLFYVENNDGTEFITAFNAFSHLWEGKASVIADAADPKDGYSRENAGKIYSVLEKQKKFFKESPRKTLKVQKEYDPSDDGQPRIYSTFFAQERAVLRGERHLFADFKAWKEGRGELFPDLMATLRGERPLFANLRATIERLIKELKAKWAAEKPKEGEPEPEGLPADSSSKPGV
jgi:hypothetical protein